MKVIPALLTPSIEELYTQIKTFSPYFSYFQIDICDGTFVPNTTVSTGDILRTIGQLDTTILKKLIFDFDLMVEDYESAVNDIKKLAESMSIENIFIHASAVAPKPLPVVKSIAIGLAFDPQDQIADIALHYDLTSFSALQIMTVVPGFQGSPFSDKELDKIDQLRLLGYRNKIYIDGSVNDKTIPIIMGRKNKPDFLGVGSFLTKAYSIKERVAYFQKALHE